MIVTTDDGVELDVHLSRGSATAADAPVVIVCHGFIQNRRAFEAPERSMLDHLRSLGVCVAVIELRGRHGSGTAAGLHLVLGDVRLPVPVMAAGLLHEDDEVLLGSRPEYTDLSVDQRPDSLPGTVAVVENLGAAALVSVEIGDLMVQAVVPEGEEPRVGEPAWLTPQNARALVYRRDDGILVANPKEQPAATERAEPVKA